MTVLWAGGEDSDFAFIGTAAVITTANSFRSSVARCALNTPGSVVNVNLSFWRAANVFSAASFWHSARLNTIANGTNGPTGQHLLRWMDSSSIVRLRIRNTIAGGLGLQNLVVETVDAAGTAVQIGSALSINMTAGSAYAATPDKIDVFVNYAVSGSVLIYVNGVQSFSYSGDITTNGVTALAGFDLGAIGAGSNLSCAWSEIIVADTDTRSWSLQTFAPVANGNTHNFDVGSPAAANVNEITLNDATLDGSTAAGQIDEYTCPAVASGTFAVQAFGVSARLQKGSSGPSKADLLVRTGGADFASADQSLTTAWANYQNWWQTNPNTAAAWATSEIGNASGFNIGVKSVT